MKNFKSLTLALSMLGFSTFSFAHDVGNWSSTAGEIWKNTPGECWRTGFWTPANALPGCDGAITDKAEAPAAPPAAAASSDLPPRLPWLSNPIQ